MDHGGFGLGPVSLWISCRNWCKSSNWSLQTIFGDVVSDDLQWTWACESWCCNQQMQSAWPIRSKIRSLQKWMSNNIMLSTSAISILLKTPIVRPSITAGAPLRTLTLSCFLHLLMIASICFILQAACHQFTSATLVDPLFLWKNGNPFLERWIF